MTLALKFGIASMIEYSMNIIANAVSRSSDIVFLK
jgi:hypothetical protein